MFNTFAPHMDPYGPLEMPLFSNGTPQTTTLGLFIYLILCPVLYTVNLSRAVF